MSPICIEKNKIKKIHLYFVIVRNILTFFLFGIKRKHKLQNDSRKNNFF